MTLLATQTPRHVRHGCDVCLRVRASATATDFAGEHYRANENDDVGVNVRRYANLCMWMGNVGL